MKKFFILILASVCILACEKTPEEIPVSSVSLSQPTAEMIIGETVQLTANIQPSNATEKSIIWASSKQSVATVSDRGLVTAIAEGTSTVTASAGGKSATCTITVSKKVVEVSSIELDRTELSLEEEQSVTLIATVKPDDATDKTVSWTSSDTAVATVDDEGKVTGIKEGTATVLAKAGDKQVTCAVTVSKKVIPVESISLNKSDLNLEKGKSETLIATVKPDDATDKTVTWSSSDDAIATVEQTGKVLAIGGGEAVITAKAGDKTATCKVTVTVPIESISLDNTSLSLEEGQSATLVATVKPDDASDKTVAWGSSDEKIATVENGKVSAIKEGSVTITATAGDKKATCKVTVQKKVVAVASVSLSQTAITLYEGQSTTLVATVKPDDATDKTVTWNTSDASVATVSNGVVTAKKIGTAAITAKAGDKEATCSVTVEATPVTSVTLDKTSASLKVGETVTLTATVKPDDATNKTVTWSTSDASVATVSDGVVTAIKLGAATITAKAGDKEATCAITVEPTPVTSVTLDKTSASLEIGETINLTATVKPDDATEKTVKWTSSDPAVATVEEGIVTALSVGESTIEASVGDKSASCVITVIEHQYSIAEIGKLKDGVDILTAPLLVVAKATLGFMVSDETGNLYIHGQAGSNQVDVGDKIQFRANKTTYRDLPELTNLYNLYKISTNNTINHPAPSELPDVEHVDLSEAPFNTFTYCKAKGELTSINAQSGGISYNITPSGSLSTFYFLYLFYPYDYQLQSDFYKSIEDLIGNGLIVEYEGYFMGLNTSNGALNFLPTSIKTLVTPVSSITLDKTSASLKVGETVTLTATVKPDDATNKTVTWSSSNDALVKVENGVVAAIKEGTATITANAGDKYANCEVTVKKNHQNEAIQFADVKAKERLVASFDTNQDGELSYGEAAAVSSIKGAFGDMKGIKSFDEFQYFTSVKMIPAQMFKDWAILESITLPQSITEIGSNAFQGCNKLRGIVIPDGVKRLPAYCFEYCYDLVSVRLPKDLEVLGGLAFSRCTSLASIELPSALIELGEYAFTYCEELVLSSEQLPEGLKIIGAGAFHGCKKITSLIIPDSVTRIDYNAFKDSGLQNVKLPAGLEIIALASFQGCTSLKSITIPETVFKIENSAFASSGLKQITLPDLVSEIQYTTFSGCRDLETVILSKNLTNIGSRAFGSCEKLSTLSIPESVTRIGAGAFKNCTGLKTLYIKATTPPTIYNTQYISSDPILYEAGNCSIYVPVGTIDAYKAANGWDIYADRIQEIQD